jgi:hypothetical protein
VVATRNGQPSAIIAETDEITPPNAGTPSKPTGLGVTLDGNGVPSFTWTDNSDNETGFTVFEIAPDGTRTQIATGGQDATSAIGTQAANIADGTSYDANASNPNGSSAASAAATTQPLVNEAKWTAAALARAGLDLDTWNPRDGYQSLSFPRSDNVANQQKIYDYYKALYTLNSNFEWAGMARMAGGPIVRALRTARGMEQNSAALAADLGGLLGMVEAAIASASKSIEIDLLTMQKDIFLDLAWQHEAYIGDGVAGGIDEMRRLNALPGKPLADDALQAWEFIDGGIRLGHPNTVWQGNELLLKREQQVVLNPGYKALNKKMFIPTLMSLIAENPFRVSGGAPFNNGVVDALAYQNLTNFEQRWSWIQAEMVTPWEAETPARRDFFIKSNFNMLVTDFPGY